MSENHAPPPEREFDVASICIPAGKKNAEEIDETIGRIRMRCLIPYARAQLGLPPIHEGPEEGQNAEKLSLKRDQVALAAKLGCGVEKIRKFVRLIREKGIENVRASDFLKKAPGGGKGTCKVREAIRKPMFEAVKKACVQEGHPPGSARARKAIRLEMVALGVPSSKIPGRQALNAATYSPAIVSLHSGAVNGEHMGRVVDLATEAIAPNQMIFMDATVHSNESEPEECIYALNEAGKNMGLVNVIYGLDGATRGIWTVLGYVGAANGFLSGLAIHRGLLAKDALLAKYGIKGPWLWCGKPRRFVTDRGKEFIGRQTQRVIQSMDIMFSDRSPPRTAFYRAKAERFNRTAHKLYANFLKSEVGKKYFREVPGIPHATGILFKDIDRALIEWVVECYHVRGHAGLGGVSPIDRLFQMANGEVGFPLSGFPPPVADRSDLLWDFLWEEHRVINHLGISMINRRYNDERLTEFLVPGKRSSVVRQSVRFNPYGIGSVFVRKPDTLEIIPIRYIHNNDQHPMSAEDRQKAINPSIWEWRSGRHDLKRVGISKPTPSQVEEVIQARENHIRSLADGASMGAITRQDLTNLEMRDNFAAILPAAISAPASSNILPLPPKRPSQMVLLPTGSGGASEY